MRLRDKVAVVTGGGGGIGRAIAQRFAAEGAAVAIGEIVEERGNAAVTEIERNGGRGIFVPTDIAVPEQIDRLFDQTLAHYGRIDVLVSNAYGPFELTKRDGRLLDIEDALWDAVMHTTLRSVFYAMRRAVREMLQSGGGSIVNMSSVNGLFAYGQVAYSTAKGAIVALTRASCLEYADRGIRMNVIAPGTVETESTRPMLADAELRRQTESLYARGSVGRPEEIAAVALFLASEESSYMNGAVLVVDGGLTVGPTEFGLSARLSELGR